MVDAGFYPRTPPELSCARGCAERKDRIEIQAGIAFEYALEQHAFLNRQCKLQNAYSVWELGDIKRRRPEEEQRELSLNADQTEWILFEQGFLRRPEGGVEASLTPSPHFVFSFF